VSREHWAAPREPDGNGAANSITYLPALCANHDEGAAEALSRTEGVLVVSYTSRWGVDCVVTLPSLLPKGQHAPEMFYFLGDAAVQSNTLCSLTSTH